MSNSCVTQKETAPWLGLEAPRYTSYPTAHHFFPQTGENTLIPWLKGLPGDAAISVYVHIPFCRQLCWFCGCHTKMTNHYAPIARYVRVMLEEIALLKRYAGGKGRLANIHFGGGSPGLLEAQDMEAILSSLVSMFEMRPSGELAIELDPRTTTSENIERYAAWGFNRVSIGIQDFDPQVQQAINRVQPYPLVESRMLQLREAGISRINCDLIYGLPHQTPESFRATLEQTIALEPSRIALFSYAHLPQMKKHQRMIDAATLPSETAKLALYAMARALLEAAGYVTIGIDHFAKMDDPLSVAAQERVLKRNFQGYVTDTTDALIGIGSSAISQFPQGYAQNSANAQDYRKMIGDGQLPIVRGWKCSVEDRARKQVIDEIMCFMSVNLAEIRKRYGLDENYFQQEISDLQKLEYQEIAASDREHIQVITEHRMAARVVASVFDQYRGIAPGRYSKVA